MFKNHFYLRSILLLVAAGLVLTSCDPARIAARNLLGGWEVTSFTEDGVELMNADLSVFDMEFEEYDGDEGDFSWTLVGNNGSTVTLSGEYSINADGDELEMTFQSGSLNGQTFEFDMSLEDDDLELAGNVDGFRWDIEAERD